jgi:hypothetical protein
MTEHPVSDIVHERCGQCDSLLVLHWLVILSFDVPGDDFHQLSRCVKYADAMSKSRVSGSRINKLRESKLSDSPKSLKGRRFNNPPEHLLQLAGIKLDQIMQGIAYPLRFWTYCSTSLL